MRREGKTSWPGESQQLWRFCVSWVHVRAVVSHARSWAIIKFRFARLVRVASATSPEKLCPLHQARSPNPSVMWNCGIFSFLFAWHSKQQRECLETRLRLGRGHQLLFFSISFFFLLSLIVSQRKAWAKNFEAKITIVEVSRLHCGTFHVSLNSAQQQQQTSVMAVDQTPIECQSQFGIFKF